MYLVTTFSSQHTTTRLLVTAVNCVCIGVPQCWPLRYATSLEQGRDGRPAVVGYAVPHYGAHNSTILYPTIPLFKAVAYVTMLSVYNFLQYGTIQESR